MKRRNNTVQIFSIFFCLFAGLFFLTQLFQGSFLPYVGYNAWNFNTYSLIAHNYLHFGFFETKYAPIISISQSLPAFPEYYLNHPPFLSIVQSVFFAFFGESFFIGRLPNIFASFLSLILLSFLARKLVSKSYSYIVFIVGSVTPASILFGKMIGQESLLLLFVLAVSYFSLLYEDTKKKRFLAVVFLASLFGSLTDWPMIYFSVIFSIFLFFRRQYVLIILTLGTAIVTSTLYFLYVYFLTGDVSFLLSGFLNRSIGELLQKPNWYISWLGTIVTRLFFYFNPLIVLFSFSYLYPLVKEKTTIKRFKELLLVFFVFGAIHVILYPEGSFGHPYWLYYLLPFVVLASGIIMQKMLSKKRYILLTLLFVFSVVYVAALNTWKTREVEGNVFRYELAKIASSEIAPYQIVALNKSGVIDPDIFEYSFHVPTVILEVYIDSLRDAPFKNVIYSCMGTCPRDEVTFQSLQRSFSSTQFVGAGVEMWVFSQRSNMAAITSKKQRIHLSIPKNDETLLKKLHRTFLKYSSTPQL